MCSRARDERVVHVLKHLPRSLGWFLIDNLQSTNGVRQVNVDAQHCPREVISLSE